MTQKYDAVIIGGGHNGLVCAFYLARAGMKVRIVERREIFADRVGQRFRRRPGEGMTAALRFVDELLELGVARVLTSGGQATAHRPDARSTSTPRLRCCNSGRSPAAGRRQSGTRAAAARRGGRS